MPPLNDPPEGRDSIKEEKAVKGKAVREEGKGEIKTKLMKRKRIEMAEYCKISCRLVRLKYAKKKKKKEEKDVGVK